jgi:predicted nucleic acid-binding protein
VILADTSAWVEFLRRTGTDLDARMTELTRSRTVVVTEPVQMELLAGRIPSEVRFRRLLGTFPTARVESGDYTTAAALYRSARSLGRTPRSLLDCVIAAVAIRHDLPLLAADRDFDAIAAVSGLRLEPVRP